ncbi:hypothetical protein NDU88_007467 [Pleurodeles waltl]|uniref:Uncharacterized protein n=1 Tax=Pleurodeles waltl TaxID=8319 RepID=A0AAV7N2B0_PLEWA|nr:hypothetical protein NDU88_007467 [Pleurodeles waltl]
MVCGYTNPYGGNLTNFLHTLYGKALNSLILKLTCDGSDRVDPHTTTTCAAAAPDSPEAARRASLPIRSPQCSRGGWAVKGVAPPPQEETIRRRIQKEPTSERITQRWSDHGRTEGGDAWNPWEESEPEPTPLQYRPRDEDRRPRGAHA